MNNANTEQNPTFKCIYLLIVCYLKVGTLRYESDNDNYGIIIAHELLSYV